MWVGVEVPLGLSTRWLMTRTRRGALGGKAASPVPRCPQQSSNHGQGKRPRAAPVPPGLWAGRGVSCSSTAGSCALSCPSQRVLPLPQTLRTATRGEPWPGDDVPQRRLSWAKDLLESETSWRARRQGSSVALCGAGADLLVLLLEQSQRCSLKRAPPAQLQRAQSLLLLKPSLPKAGGLHLRLHPRDPAQRVASGGKAKEGGRVAGESQGETGAGAPRLLDLPLELLPLDAARMLPLKDRSALSRGPMFVWGIAAGAEGICLLLL